MWYDDLVVLWDGSNTVALHQPFDSVGRAGDRALLIRSHAGTAAPRLIARLAEFTCNRRMHVVKLPPGHRSLDLSFESEDLGSLSIAFDNSLAKEHGTDWRLVLVGLNKEGPEYLCWTDASLKPFRAFYKAKLRTVRDQLDQKKRALLWGGRYLQRVRTRHRDKNRELIVSACSPVLPDGTFVAPIEMSVPASRGPSRSRWAMPHDRGASHVPAVARAILDETRRQGERRFGLALRTSRNDPTTLWLQQRSAIIHVRHQARAAAQIEGALGEPEQYATLPLRAHDFRKIRDPSLSVDENEDGEPALKAYNLFELLEKGEDAAKSVTVTVPDGDGDGEPDEVAIEFEHASLGDDIGLIATQAMVLTQPGPGGASTNKPADIVMFNITESGLRAFEVTQSYRSELLAAAVAAQRYDRWGDPASDRKPAVATPHAAWAEWSMSILRNGGIPLPFGVIEPIPTLAALSLIERTSQANEAGRILAAYHSDPALCALLVERKSGSGSWTIPQPANLTDSLLTRLAAAINRPGLIDAGGVAPEAESEALRIVADEQELRQKLAALRISLDASTQTLHTAIDTVQAVLGDVQKLKSVAKGDFPHLKHMTEQAADYLERTNKGEWTTLKQASALAKAIGEWEKKKEKYREKIEEIEAGPEVPPPPPSATAGQIRDRIREMIGKAEPGSAAERACKHIEQHIDLDELDLLLLNELAIKLTALIGGGEHENLIDNILERLEKWAGLPDFFVGFGGDGTHAAGKAANFRRKEGAKRFLGRARKMHKSQTTQGQDSFTRRRSDLAVELRKQRGNERGLADIPDSDFEEYIVPAADHLLHHRAFQALKALVDQAQAVQIQASNDNAAMLVRKIRRGLAAWPHRAAANWDSGLQLASRLEGESGKDRLNRQIQLPDFG